MPLQRTDVEKIAYLARLELQETAIPTITRALNAILALANQMQSVDTAHIKPLAHPLEGKQRLRPDQAEPSASREAYQTIAPATENGLYLVPKVID